LGPNGVAIQYKSLCDVVSNAPEATAQEMAIVESEGIDWHGLTEGQQIYLILTAEFGMPQQ